MLIIWIGLFIIFLLLEIATVSLVSIWFCLGALLAGIFCLLGASLPLQIAGFFIGSFLGMFILYPIKKKLLKPKKTNIQSIIGETGVVIKPLHPLDFSGQVKVQSQIWSATAKEEIEQGEHVVVEKIIGAHVEVRRLD